MLSHPLQTDFGGLANAWEAAFDCLLWVFRGLTQVARPDPGAPVERANFWHLRCTAAPASTATALSRQAALGAGPIEAAPGIANGAPGSAPSSVPANLSEILTVHGPVVAGSAAGRIRWCAERHIRCRSGGIVEGSQGAVEHALAVALADDQTVVPFKVKRQQFAAPVALSIALFRRGLADLTLKLSLLRRGEPGRATAAMRQA